MIKKLSISLRVSKSISPGFFKTKKKPSAKKKKLWKNLQKLGRLRRSLSKPRWKSHSLLKNPSFKKTLKACLNSLMNLKQFRLMSKRSNYLLSRSLNNINQPLLSRS